MDALNRVHARMHQRHAYRLLLVSLPTCGKICKFGGRTEHDDRPINRPADVSLWMILSPMYLPVSFVISPLPYCENHSSNVLTFGRYRGLFHSMSGQPGSVIILATGSLFMAAFDVFGRT